MKRSFQTLNKFIRDMRLQSTFKKSWYLDLYISFYSFSSLLELSLDHAPYCSEHIIGFLMLYGRLSWAFSAD